MGWFRKQPQPKQWHIDEAAVGEGPAERDITMTDPVYGIDEVLDYLDIHRIRATYRAVGLVTGLNWREGLGPRLAAAGGPSRRTSWVVQSSTGLPSPSASECAGDRNWWHLRLEDNAHIIRDPDELHQRITDWKQPKR